MKNGEPFQTSTSAVSMRSAYVILSMVAAAHAVNHAYTALMPILYPAIMAELKFNYSQLGLLLGISRMFGQGFQWLAGYMGRFFKRKTLLGFGAIFQGVFLALSGTASNFFQLTGWQTLNRLAGSPQHPNGNSLILEHFGKEARGKALGINFAGGNVGTVIVPLMGAGLLGFLGWRSTLAAFALPGIVIGFILLFLVREENRATDAGAGKAEKPHLGRETLLVLKKRNMLLILLAQATAAGGRGLGILITFVPLYLSQQLKMSVLSTGMLYTIMMIGSVAGPTLAGVVSDRVPQRKLVLVTTYLCSTIMTVLFIHLGHYTWLLPVILFVMGCFVYSESPMLQSLAADSTEELPKDVVFGVFFTFGFGSGALWAVAIGYLVNRFGFIPAFYVMAASYTVGALWIAMMKLGKPAILEA
ncbi:MAG: MFS transporter [Candidatus Tectomicrobia bacterium]|uniref:MFS transporter n=1 Tax=Tectimicrobiota bacterium TaxID=2528274 RepID=A0A932GPU2_UNCTE|nr:MFS transporter [Candidatus Tectomicrobia bacterium]